MKKFNDKDQVLAQYRKIHNMTKEEMVDEVKYFYSPFNMELLDAFENGEEVFSYTIQWAIQQAFGIDMTDKDDHERMLEYAAACQVARELYGIQLNGLRVKACKQLNIDIDEFKEDIQDTAKQLIEDTPGGNALSIQPVMRHAYDLLRIYEQVNGCAKEMRVDMRRPVKIIKGGTENGVV